MKPVFVRELKELSPALVVALAFAVIAGANSVGPLSRQFDDILAVACVGAVFLGCYQGGLDHWRKGDVFALHRPVPAARMEIARTLAGLTVALLGIVALVITHRLATLVHIADLARMEAAGIRMAGGMPPEHLGGGEFSLLTGLLLATWGVTRFPVGAVRVRWALPAFVVVPCVSWSLLSHARTLPAATAVSFLFAALFTLGSGLCLAGDRR